MTDRAEELRSEALMLAEEQRARPVLLRILLDVSRESGSVAGRLDELLRTTCESFPEDIEIPEILAARQICSE
jgi:hypothetical protein